MKYSILLAGIFSLTAALPASAQEWGVNRRLFTFLADEVTVEVNAESEGTLHVVRGERGRLDVSGRVLGGLSAFALGGRDGSVLRLTAVGGDNADFIVVVPEDTYLRVRLPNRKNGDLGSTRPGGTFKWPAADGSESSAAPIAPPPGAPAIAHVADVAPRVLNVPRLNSARTITVKVEPGFFEVGSTRWMAVTNGSTTNVEIRTGNVSEDLVISVPSDTRDFALRLGGRTALTIQDGAISAYCEPLVQQVLAGGAARRYTFTPEMGRLTCR
ncbi:MAG: hypothetical protein ACT4O1_06625 [Gemmatimonadota bacterium]